MNNPRTTIGRSLRWLLPAAVDTPSGKERGCVVGPGTPAAAAGLQVDGVITGIADKRKLAVKLGNLPISWPRNWSTPCKTKPGNGRADRAAERRRAETQPRWPAVRWP
jgi:hypothetical protein